MNRKPKAKPVSEADNTPVVLQSPRDSSDNSTKPQAAGAFKKPPTAGDVYALWSYRLSQYDELGLRAYIEEVRALFDMKQAVRIPREYRATTKEIRTPFLRDASLRIAASLTKDRPIPDAIPADESVSAEKAASITGKFIEACWEQMDKDRDNEADAIYMSSRYLVRDSESVLKVVDRANAWANFPTREADEAPEKFLKRRERAKMGKPIPFASRLVDRLNMVFGDGEYGTEWGIEYGIYPAPMIAGQYGMAAIDGDPDYILPQFKIGGKPVPMGYPVGQSLGGGQTLKLEYWDKDWWVVTINGKMAPDFPKKNPYAPSIPYFRAVGEPVLYSLRYLVPAIDALLTMQQNWAYLAAFPVPKLKPLPNNQQNPALDLPTGDPSEAPVGFTWKPGFAMAPPPGYDLEFMSPPPAGADIEKLVTILRDLVDVAGIPSIFRGIGGARQAGYAVNQLMAAASLAYRQLGRALQRQFEKASEFMLDVIEDMDETVYVRAYGNEGQRVFLGVKGSGDTTENIASLEDIAGVEFEFKPVMPTDEQAMEMIAIQAVNAPKQLMSKETALRDYFQVADPQAELDRIVVENTMDTDPTLHMLVVSNALKKAKINPPEPPQPPGLVGPNGQPLPPSAPPGGGPPPMTPPGVPGVPQPMVPGGTAPLAPVGGAGAPPATNRPAGSLPHGGGRAAGSFPGRPSGSERAA